MPYRIYIYLAALMAAIGGLSYIAMSFGIPVRFIAFGAVVLTALAAMIAVSVLLRKYSDD